MRRIHPFLKQVAFVVAGSAAVAAALFFVYRTPARPWEASGRLVVLTKSVSDLTATSVLSFSVDELALVAPGETRALTIRSRRVTVNPHTEAQSMLVDTQAPSGSYTGLTLEIRSPALSSLTETSSPTVALQKEQVDLPLTFSITENDTTVIIVGFETQHTLRATTSGMVYLPTLHAEVRSGASINAQADEHVNVDGGTIVRSLLFGMDTTGRMRLNYREPSTSSLPAPAELQPPFLPSSSAEATSTAEEAGTTTSPDTARPEPEDVPENAATTSSSS